MNPNDGNAGSPPGQAGLARRGFRYPLIIAGLFSTFLGGLAYLGGGLRGLWNWDSRAAVPGATRAGRAAETNADGPLPAGGWSTRLVASAATAPTGEAAQRT